MQQQQLAGAVRRHLAGRREARRRSRAGSRSTKAKELLADAGQNFDSLKAAGGDEGLQARPAQRARRTSTSRSTSRKIQSHNVVAKLEGTRQEGRVRRLHRALGPPRPDTTLKGDQIYNGAIDNASGTRGAARDREGVHEAADAAAALDPVPLGHGGREGAPRRQVLRDASAVSARPRPSRTSTWTASTSGARRATSP